VTGRESGAWSHSYFASLDFDPAVNSLDYAAANARYLEKARDAVVREALSPTGEMLKALLGTSR
jgi:hypothetical protein